MNGRVKRQFGLAILHGVRSPIPYSCPWGFSADKDIANHHAIFKNVFIKPIDYAYYSPATIGLDIEGLLGAMRTAPGRSVFLLHACAHNPTGVDPTREQWAAIVAVMKEKKHYAFFDCAYQGFASGNLEDDAWAVRYFLDQGVPMLVCQVCSVSGHHGICSDRRGCRALRRTPDCTESVSGHYMLFRQPKRRPTG
jgi:aspartate aminotransferase